MKLLLSFLLCLASSTFAIPLDPNEEVELVEPLITNEGNPQIGDDNPFEIFGGDTFLDGSFFNGGINEGNLPEIPFKRLFPSGIFGESDEELNCGLLCRILKNLDSHIHNIEKEMKEVRDKQNEVDGDEIDDSEQGPTYEYEEKILDDGSVVKINKTRHHRISDDGTSFFSFTQTKLISGNANNPKADDEEKEIIDNSRNISIPENVERLRRSVQQQQSWDEVQFDQQQQRWNDVYFDKPFPKKNFKKLTPKKKYPSYYSLPISLEDDTRVNDIISETASRGGLILLDPDSELIEIRED